MPSACSPVLTVENVTLSYGGRTVISECSCTIDQGGHYALTGRSGSGKTSLLLLLAGFLPPTTGKVTTTVAAREVIYIPQAPSLIPELTVTQNASLGLRLRGVPPVEAVRRGVEALRLLGLGGDSDEALPGQLSGGMQQRVTLARALAVGPAVLLVDEPTGALDQTTGRLVLDALVRHAHENQTTMVLATHDPSISAMFGQQIRLERGGA